MPQPVWYGSVAPHQQSRPWGCHYGGTLPPTVDPGPSGGEDGASQGPRYRAGLSSGNVTLLPEDREETNHHGKSTGNGKLSKKVKREREKNKKKKECKKSTFNI